MILIRVLLTRVSAICGLAGLLSCATCPQTAHATDAKWLLSIELSTRNAHELVDLLRTLDTERAGVRVDASQRTLRIAGPPAEIERLARIIRQVDDPDTAGQQIWTIRAPGIASNRTERLEMLVERDAGWPDRLKIPKFVPDDVGHRVIVLADAVGFQRVKRLELERFPPPCADNRPIELPIGPRARSE
jgi:hypothetical protein